MPTTIKKLLAFMPVLLLAACATPPPVAADNEISPAFHRPEAGKLILLLPTEPDTADMRAGTEILKAQMHKQLTAAGYKVVLLDRGSYDTIWAEEVKAVGGIYDPATGKLRRAEFTKAFSYLVQRVSEETKAALVLHPGLVLRNAAFAGQNAVWDGQLRRVPVIGLGGDSIRHDGSTLALSVELKAFTPKGEFAMRRYGGASLPFRSNYIDNKNEVRTDLFDSDVELAEAVAMALAPITLK